MLSKNNNEEKLTIAVKEFYPENCSEENFVEVDRRTYAYLCGDKVHSESRARKDRRYIAAFGFDETEAGERDGIFSESAEEEYFKVDECELLYKAIDMLSEYERKLITIYYFENKKLLQIQDELGIAKSTASRHLKKAEKNLRKYYLILMQSN